ncbi:hypothetical protein [Pseudoramibacter porci]|uniref:Uncharacterized protein n=1 Tax=Pseudoramibacter porci TaxID=2606631 RepID=A0A7X2NH87_9FIRM|nr:hypothetical protein [Pseudoramibacter porci]MSS20391.1 hypothetical protein [Pseudoramibacter porci]
MASAVIGSPSEALKALISGRMRFGRAEGRLNVYPAEKPENGHEVRFRLRLENPSYDTAVLSDFTLVLYGEGDRVLSETPVLEDVAPVTLRAWQHKTLTFEAAWPDSAAAAAVTWQDRRQHVGQTPAIDV